MRINNFVLKTQSVRPSFCEMLEIVKEGIEFECIDEHDKTWAVELCKIITEVMLLNPGGEIRIAGEDMSVSLVQEIYSQLACEHITSVICNYRKVTKKIKNKRAYLRTMLYTAFFEEVSENENDFAMLERAW
ncbi:MAG: DUF6017 domain-containing protein [Oscillospiraceae bacterium]|nr:DUF6017 domain-containing protein [Oscillospiraceae bacterium]